MKSKHKPIKALLALQGGGSAGSFTWGALDHLLSNPDLEFIAISGTSAGAMNGRKIAKSVNEHGWTAQGREEARQGLNHLWANIMRTDPMMTPIRIVDHILDTQRTILSSNPFNPFNHRIEKGFDIVDHAMRFGYSRALEAYLRHTNDNPTALKSTDHTTLYVNAVDQNHREAVWSGQDLTTERFLATAALREHFQAVHINGQYYEDGAYYGGSNPNMQVLLDHHGQQADVMIVVMTNPPQHPIRPRLQRDIPQCDLEETNDLILHHVWDEVAFHMHAFEIGKSAIPIIVIYPDIETPFTAKDKQRTDRHFIEGAKAKGIARAAKAEQESIKQGHIIPNMTVSGIQRVAKKTRRMPVAA